MGFLDKLRRKKQTEPTAADRREFLLKHGRICDGVITENDTDENGEEIVQYYYNIQGVDFESSEILTEEQRQNPLKYAPGAKVGVRFDPKNHGNSTLA